MITLAWRKTYIHTRAYAARVFFSSTEHDVHMRNNKNYKYEDRIEEEEEEKAYTKFSTDSKTYYVHEKCEWRRRQ